MTWKSYFFPQTILITSSPYNHYIRINEENGKLKLLVNGSRQSGTYIESLWKKTFHRFFITSHKGVHTSCVLGVGGGTVMTLLHNHFPKTTIVGVDIDPVMLEIAKKYFHVDQIPGTKYVSEDAEVYVKAAKTKKCYFDLIVIDLFVGRHIPEFVPKKQFIQSVRSILNTDGILLINYLREQEYKEKSVSLFHTLSLMFPVVMDFSIANNRFFYCRK